MKQPAIELPAIITQDFRIISEHDRRLTKTDSKGSEWYRLQDTAKALEMVVQTLCTDEGSEVYGKPIAYMSCSPLDLPRLSSEELFAWRAEPTRKMQEAFNLADTAVRSAFVSRKVLPIDHPHHELADGLPLEQLPLYRAAAQHLSKKRLGAYIVKIDTDITHPELDRVTVLGIGEGSGASRNHGWTDFNVMTQEGLEVFQAWRDEGHDMQPALIAADETMSRLAGSLANRR